MPIPSSIPQTGWRGAYDRYGRMSHYVRSATARISKGYRKRAKQKQRCGCRMSFLSMRRTAYAERMTSKYKERTVMSVLSLCGTNVYCH